MCGCANRQSAAASTHTPPLPGIFMKGTRSSASGNCWYVISRATAHRLSLSYTICHGHVPLAATIATPWQHSRCHCATDLPSSAPAPLTQAGQKLTKQQLETCHLSVTTHNPCCPVVHCQLTCTMNHALASPNPMSTAPSSRISSCTLTTHP